MENLDTFHYATVTIETPDKNTLEVNVYFPVKYPDLDKLQYIVIPISKYEIKYYFLKEINNYAINAECVKEELLKLHNRCSPEYYFVPDQNSGLKFLEAVETYNKVFPIEHNQEKLNIFRKRKEDINKVKTEIDKLNIILKNELEKPRQNKRVDTLFESNYNI